MAKQWNVGDIPDQTGKVVVITGANSGLGYASAGALAGKGAHVVMAVRNLEAGGDARDRIMARLPEASLEVAELDLASLASVREFARRFKERHDRLDILMNNAGVMATPQRTTADGFELQFGTNHLGHFAMTGLLLDRLLASPGSRVVTTSSVAEWSGWINFDDLMRERFYERWTAYGQSKLANLLFTFELQRRLERAGATTTALAAHPGFAETHLRERLMTPQTPVHQRLLLRFFESLSQPGDMGALPQLYAATAPGARGGEYYGPDGFLQRAGYPTRVRASFRARDTTLAARLWQVSEELTRVTYDFK